MRLRAAIAAALVIAASVLAAMIGGSPSTAAAAGPNRAVVVADSGTGVIVRGIEFDSDSISGVEALQLAGLAPVLQGFDGQGGAVCALQGVGCPSDGSCLTCDARGYYWAYHRAPAGSSGFTYSRAGAGSTRVANGDVEGWKWGTGAAPPFHSFASVFPEPVAPPPATDGGSGDSGGSSGGGGPAAVPGGGGAVDPGAPAATPGSSPDAGGTTTTAVGTDTPTTATTAAGSDTAAASQRSGGTDADAVEFQAAQSSRSADASTGRGWVASVGLFVLTVGVIVLLVWRTRRNRHRPA